MAVISTHDSSFWINWWQLEAGTIDEKLFEIMCQKAGIPAGHYKYSKQVLFDKKKSVYGRLYWNDSVSSVEYLCNVLNKSRDELGSLVYAYLESYGEKQKFMHYLNYAGDISEKGPSIVEKCLQMANNSNSIFSIQLLQEYLSLNEELLAKISKVTTRINTPGIVSKNNWSQLMPLSLEGLLNLNENPQIRNIISITGRQ
jgi:4-alpha-glucanotransferase